MRERKIDCEDLQLAVDQFRQENFTLELIFPADDPHTAVLVRGGDRVRLTTQPDSPAPDHRLPRFVPDFVLARNGGEERRGRAGMHYRDLIPNRLGGRYIASLISVPDAAVVEDWVHFHQITLQVLFVRRGWVRVAYEDQGESIVMREGDLVLQPPGIRHCVIGCSNGLEVIELSAPANHATFADHHLELPNGANPMRRFGEQRFLHHIGAQSPWREFSGGGEVQETELHSASGGLAAARSIRSAGATTIAFAPHDGEISSAFVLGGSASLACDQKHELGSGDAFVIPPGKAWRLECASHDLSLLHVTTNQLG